MRVVFGSLNPTVRFYGRLKWSPLKILKKPLYPTTHLFSIGANTGSSWADDILKSRSKTEIEDLKAAICRLDAISNKPGDGKLSYEQLRLVFLCHATPFLGFGFLDNFVMIIAGEYIDLTLAAVFGFSTMAAAGLGNLISDLCGLGLVGYVEKYATLFGVQMPSVSQDTLASKAARRASNLGRMFGITLGCLIGMFPLLFIPKADSVESSLNQTYLPVSDEDD